MLTPFALVISLLLGGCETWTSCLLIVREGDQVETRGSRRLLRISYLEHKSNDWVQEQEQLVCWHTGTSSGNFRDGNLHCPGMSHATTASPKPSFRAPRRVGDAMVGGRNAECNIREWTSLPIPALLPMAFRRKVWKEVSSVCFCVVCSFEKEDFLEKSRILSRFVQLKSVLFNLLCVFVPFKRQKNIHLSPETEKPRKESVLILPSRDKGSSVGI